MENLNLTNLIGKSVLFVEDDPKIRNLIKIYLIKEGYEVIEANNRVESKGKIRFHVLLTALLGMNISLLVIIYLKIYFNGGFLCISIEKI